MKCVSQPLLRLLGSALLCVQGVAQAVTYATALEDADWRADGNIFECRLSHKIPYYGGAVFSRRAGESPRFYLKAHISRMKTGEASLVAESPLWRPAAGVRQELGMVPVKQGRQPVNLGQPYSERMLSALRQGMQVVLSREPWYEEDSSVRVALAPVNFQKPYRKYLDCLMGLLPVNFDQVSHTKIYFPSGAEELPARERRKLDNVALYIKADPAVTGFYIDGHSDSKGSRADNLKLSKMRAEIVAQYLINRGIDASRITVRWHGERYPVATNRSLEGQNLNRRVTVRLEKGGTARAKDTEVVRQQKGVPGQQASLPAGTDVPAVARNL